MCVVVLLARRRCLEDAPPCISCYAELPAAQHIYICIAHTRYFIFLVADMIPKRFKNKNNTLFQVRRRHMHLAIDAYRARWYILHALARRTRENKNQCGAARPYNIYELVIISYTRGTPNIVRALAFTLPQYHAMKGRCATQSPMDQNRFSMLYILLFSLHIDTFVQESLCHPSLPYVVQQYLKSYISFKTCCDKGP